jgi:putative ABC transport system permease protein
MPRPRIRPPQWFVRMARAVQYLIRRLLGTGMAVGVVLAVVAGLCAFGALALPSAGVQTADRTLRPELAAAPALNHDVFGTGDWAELTQDFSANPGLEAAFGETGTLTDSQLGAPMTSTRALLVDRGIALNPSDDWYGLSTQLYGWDVQLPPDNRGNYWPDSSEMLYRNDLTSQAKLVAGSWPDSDTDAVQPDGQGDSAALFQVAVTTATAYRLGLGLGEEIGIGQQFGPHGGLPIELRITGIVAPDDPSDPFWNYDALSVNPQVEFHPNKPNFIAPGPLAVPPGYDFAAPGQPLTPVPEFDDEGGGWESAFYIGPGEMTDLQSVVGVSTELRVQFGVGLTTSGVHAPDARQLADSLTAVQGEASTLPLDQPGASPYEVVLTGGPLSLLQGFLAQWQSVSAVLSLASTALGALAAAIVLLCAFLMDERRAAELALRRARGGGLRHLLVTAVGGSAALTIPAVLLGVLAARLLVPSPDPGPPWTRTAVVLLGAVGVPMLLTLRHRRPSVIVGRDTERPPSRKSRQRRLVLGSLVLVVTAGGVAALRGYGTAQSDLLVDLAPLLLTMPIAIALAFAVPRLVRLLARASAPRPGAVAFLALARAARGPSGGLVSAFVLVLALSTVAIGAGVRSTVLTAENQSSWNTAGADASVQSGSGYTPATISRLAAVPGATATAAVYRDVENTTAVMSAPYTVLFVDPAAYAAITAGTPGPQLPPGLPEHAPGGAASAPGAAVPAIFSSTMRELLGSQGIALTVFSNRTLTVHAIASVPATAAIPGTSTDAAFVIVPLWAARQIQGAAVRMPAPEQVLLRGADLNGTELTRVVDRLVPDSVVQVRAADLSALTGSPLQQGSFQILALDLLAALICCSMVLLAGLALGSRSRELTLARLAAMGLSRRQSTTLVIVEQVPALVGALLGGVGCALLTTVVLGTSFDLSAFTAVQGLPLPLGSDPGALAAAGAGVAALAVLTLAGHTALAYRRGITSTLRIGD